jgi:integrase
LTTLAGYKAISRKFVMRRWADKRDRTIMLTLLDMGLRASELLALKVNDVDLKSGKVQVKHGRLGGAKVGKMAYSWAPPTMIGSGQISCQRRS